MSYNITITGLTKYGSVKITPYEEEKVEVKEEEVVKKVQKKVQKEIVQVVVEDPVDKFISMIKYFIEMNKSIKNREGKSSVIRVMCHYIEQNMGIFLNPRLEAFRVAVLSKLSKFIQSDYDMTKGYMPDFIYKTFPNETEIINELKEKEKELKEKELEEAKAIPLKIPDDVSDKRKDEIVLEGMCKAINKLVHTHEKIIGTKILFTYLNDSPSIIDSMREAVIAKCKLFLSNHYSDVIDFIGPFVQTHLADQPELVRMIKPTQIDLILDLINDSEALISGDESFPIV